MQPHVDSAISKTINCPEDISFEAFKDVYLEAYALGLKGCTTYRPNAVTGAVLSRETPAVEDAGPSAKAGASDAARRRRRLSPCRRGAARPGGVVYMAQAAGARGGIWPAITYKIKWPGSDHAIYVTINDIERDGRRRPFEIFINYARTSSTTPGRWR